MSIFSRNSPIAYHKLWILVLILSLFILGGLSIAQERGPLSPDDICAEGEYVVITTNNGLECKPLPSVTQQLTAPTSCNEGEVVSFVANADGSVTGECSTPRTPYGLSLSEYAISLVPNGNTSSIQLPLTNKLLPNCKSGEIITFTSSGTPVCVKKDRINVACGSGQYIAGISEDVPDCRSLPPAYIPPVTPSVVYLYAEQHTVAQCEVLGGLVFTRGGTKFCDISGRSCPNGWTQYQSYNRTIPKTCSGSSCGSIVGTSCRTGSHSSPINIGVERCGYNRGYETTRTYTTPTGGCGKGNNPCGSETRTITECTLGHNVCLATIISVGCY